MPGAQGVAGNGFELWWVKFLRLNQLLFDEYIVNDYVPAICIFTLILMAFGRRSTEFHSLGFRYTKELV